MMAAHRGNPEQDRDRQWPRQRHLDTTASEAVKKLSKKELAKRRQDKHAQLRAEIEADRDRAAIDPEMEKLEPLPPGLDVLMDDEAAEREQPWYARIG
jgi:hypothetical protein